MGRGLAGNARRTGEDGQHSLVHGLDLARLHDVACEESYDEQRNQYRKRP